MGRPSKDTPGMIEKCLHCTRKTCTGSCGDLHIHRTRETTRVPRIGNSGGARLYAYEGELHTVGEWAKIKGITDYVLYKRLQRGWPLKKALETPMGDAPGTCRRKLEARGMVMGLTEWAKLLGIKTGTLWQWLENHENDMEAAVAYYQMRREAKERAQASGAAAKGRDKSGKV